MYLGVQYASALHRDLISLCMLLRGMLMLANAPSGKRNRVWPHRDPAPLHPPPLIQLKFIRLRAQGAGVQTTMQCPDLNSWTVLVISTSQVPRHPGLPTPSIRSELYTVLDGSYLNSRARRNATGGWHQGLGGCPVDRVVMWPKGLRA